MCVSVLGNRLAFRSWNKRIPHVSKHKNNYYNVHLARVLIHSLALRVIFKLTNIHRLHGYSFQM